MSEVVLGLKNGRKNAALDLAVLYLRPFGVLISVHILLPRALGAHPGHVDAMWCLNSLRPASESL